MYAHDVKMLVTIIGCTRQVIELCICIQCTFFAHYQALLGRPRLVSRALDCGPRRGPACTPRRKCGARQGSVARALGVQSRAIRQVIKGSLSASPSLAGHWKPHNEMFLFCCCILPVSHRHPSSQALYLVAARVQQQSRIKLFLL